MRPNPTLRVIPEFKYATVGRAISAKYENASILFACSHFQRKSLFDKEFDILKSFAVVLAS